MQREIAVCVDDFGHHGGVDAAVLALARDERINAVSCLACGPTWAAAAPALRELDPLKLDVGLHLDFTEHVAVPGLKAGLGAWMLRSTARLVDASRVRAGIAAQLDLFERSLGRLPAHVDGHQHLHHFPVVREALVEELARRYPGERPWLRRTLRVPGVPFAFKSAVIDAMGATALAALARETGFAQNRRMLGVYDFRGGGEAFASLMSTWLGAAHTGDLLMCHPATEAPGAADGLQAARLAEYRFLASPQFDELLARQDVGLARMGGLLRNPVLS